MSGSRDMAKLPKEFGAVVLIPYSVKPKGSIWLHTVLLDPPMLLTTNSRYTLGETLYTVSI